MTDQNPSSLVPAGDEEQPGNAQEETLGDSLGGYQAVVLLISIFVIAIIVFNLNALTGGDPDDAGAVAVAITATATEALPITATPSDTPTPLPTATPTDVPTETPAPTETPLPTETPAPTNTAPPTATADAEAAEPTAEPTVEEVALDPVAAALAAGDIANGQTIFNTTYTVGGAPWMCASCHTVDASEMRLIGPGLYNLHTRVDERAIDAGEPEAATYTVNSILMPNAYIVPAGEGEIDYPANVMPQGYDDVLSEQELADVVAYILSLGNPDA